MQQKIEKFVGEFEFLSNHHKSALSFHGVIYPTATHAYQAQKLESDFDRKKAASIQNPTDVIRFVKTCKRVQNWQDQARIVMKKVLRKKFENPFMKCRLIDTGDALLGDGRNFVGELLMEIREEIKLEKLS